MNLSKKVLLSLSFVILLSSFVVGRVSASSHEDSLAHRLAVRFSLNEQEVSDFLCDCNSNKDKVSFSGVSNTQSNHLDFINQKLSKGVSDGWITNSQKTSIINKIKDMMKSQPSSASFSNMSTREQEDRINSWKNEMRKWARANGTTLDQIRNLTGKGNKYLMGIEL